MENQFYRIIDNEIIIPGLKKSYSLIQISDTHLLVCDENSTEENKQKIIEYEKAWQEVKKGFADLFGEPCHETHEISTLQCFTQVMDYVKKQKPDLLLFSGDVLNHEHAEGRRYFRKYMTDYDGAWMFVPGNHDNEELPKELGIKGIQVLNLDGARVIGLDDSRMTVSKTQLEEIQQLLADGIPSILVMHTPVETNENKEMMKEIGEGFVIRKDKTDDNGRAFITLCENSQVPIVSVLCGHIHGYQKSELIPGREQICCSSGMVGFVHRISLRGEDI